MGVGQYYSRREVSNSDLGWLQQQLFPRDLPDPTNAFRFGCLIDCMITEPERVNVYTRTLKGEGYSYSQKEFDTSLKMRDAFFSDPYLRQLHSVCIGQKEMTAYRNMDWQDFEFALHTRCKWDLWSDRLGWGGDIKSTTATSQAQFEQAARYFNYDRQRAWYMDIAGSDKDILIGISKINFKIFKICINRNDEFYNEGLWKYKTLSFRWYALFGESKPEFLC